MPAKTSRRAKRSLPARLGTFIGAGAAATALFAAVPTAAHADVNVGVCVVVLGVATCPPPAVSVAVRVLPVDVCANVAGIATAEVNNCPNGTPNPTGGIVPANATVNADATAVVGSPTSPSERHLRPAAPRALAQVPTAARRSRRRQARPRRFPAAPATRPPAALSLMAEAPMALAGLVA